MLGGTQDWSYAGDTGPDCWGDLNPSYAPCKRGRAQSPIDITGAVPANLPTLSFEYQTATPTVINKDYTLQVNYPPASILRVGKDEYTLLQFHFHAPSTHTLNGQYSAMELHLVHIHASGAQAVVGVMLNLGESNRVLEPLWERMPSYAGAERPLNINFNATDLLPPTRRTYRYDGSLTTPPCNEGVLWLVMQQQMSVSQAQVDKFRTIFPINIRPTQPLNGRRVVTEG